MSKWWSHLQTHEAAQSLGHLKMFPPHLSVARTGRVPSRYGEKGMSAIEVWKQRVAAHHAQSRKVRAALGIAAVDRWEVISPLFKANPRRTDDVEVNRLVREVAP